MLIDYILFYFSFLEKKTNFLYDSLYYFKKLNVIYVIHIISEEINHTILIQKNIK